MKQISLDDIVRLLEQPLGQAKAREAVENAAQVAGLGGKTVLTSQEAESLLEAAAQKEDLVGVVARFAKTRLYLQMAKMD